MDEQPNTQVPVQGGDDDQTPTEPTLGNPDQTPGTDVGTTAGDGDVTGNVEAPDEDTNDQSGAA